MEIVQPEPVSMLKSFKREEEFKNAEILTYPLLEMQAQEARDKEGRLFNQFVDSEQDSVEEEDRARAAAVGYFVMVGLQLQHAPQDRREAISKRFTEAAVELYGKPEEEKVAELAVQELAKIKSYLGNPAVDQDKVRNLVDFYSDQVDGQTVESKPDMDKRLAGALDQMESALCGRYPRLVEVFNEATKDKKKLSPKEVTELFSQGVATLAESDPAWQDWAVKAGETRSMEADDKEKIISTGSIARTASKLLPLFAHEVLVHAQRAVNGSKTGSYMAEHGMPDYLAAEEGLAKFVQMALSGERKPVTSDIYMNTGFALGVLGQAPLARNELQSIYLDKLIVTRQAEGKEIDLEDLASKAWSHVNRIYRGSLGNEAIAVNTKDIAYNEGFTKISAYILEQLDAEKNMDDILEYLVSAKFDPTNEKHTDFLCSIAEKL